LNAILATKSDNKNQDAPVGQMIQVLMRLDISALRNSGMVKFSIFVNFITQSNTSPIKRKMIKGNSNLFTDFRNNSLIVDFLCIIPPLKKNQDIKNDSVVPIKYIGNGL
jgi:hypothetical protein